MSIVCRSQKKASDDTPLPTPTHLYNPWADNKKTLTITPRPGEQGIFVDETASTPNVLCCCIMQFCK